MKKILWLASWYPSKVSPFNGDFIQRHAHAVSIYEEVHLLHVVKDENIPSGERVRIESFVRGNLHETIAYYNPESSGLQALARIKSIFTYLKIYKTLINQFVRTHGDPACVHVHVAMWAGVLALWLKRKSGVPYYVTEHWTGYDPQSKNTIYGRDLVFKRLSRLVLKNAERVLPVSAHLGQLISQFALPVKFQQVSNVVNTEHFKLREQPGPPFRFIHVSAMSYQKNIEGLLKSFSILKRSVSNWRLIMCGPATESIISLARSLGLEDFIDWKGEIPYQQVAAEMSAAAVFVLFSRYENQPCVVLEALCCGLPVIATDVGGISEVVNDDNGLLVPTGNESELAVALQKLIAGYENYDAAQISQDASEKYNYNVIGKTISSLYNS